MIVDTQGQYFNLNYYLCKIWNIILAWKAKVLNTPHTHLEGEPILSASMIWFI